MKNLQIGSKKLRGNSLLTHSLRRRPTFGLRLCIEDPFQESQPIFLGNRLRLILFFFYFELIFHFRSQWLWGIYNHYYLLFLGHYFLEGLLFVVMHFSNTLPRLLLWLMDSLISTLCNEHTVSFLGFCFC